MANWIGARIVGRLREVAGAPHQVRPAVLWARGWTNSQELLMLYEAARAVTSGAIVEVGSYRGRSTIALALGSRAGVGRPVFALDPHEPFRGEVGATFGARDRGAFYRSMLLSRCARDVRLVNLPSEVVAAGWTLQVGMLFLDGDHSVEGCRRDWEAWRPHLLPEAKVVFDDSFKKTLGPRQVIDAEVAAGRMSRVRSAGKMTEVRLVEAEAATRT